MVRHEQNGRTYGQRICPGDEEAGGLCGNFGDRGNELITALATAYADSIPLIAITGQVSSELLGKDVFQEADITGSQNPLLNTVILSEMPERFHVFSRKLSTLHLRDAAVRC